jgi:hypothetical protein
MDLDETINTASTSKALSIEGPSTSTEHQTNRVPRRKESIERLRQNFLPADIFEMVPSPPPPLPKIDAKISASTANKTGSAPPLPVKPQSIKKEPPPLPAPRKIALKAPAAVMPISKDHLKSPVEEISFDVTEEELEEERRHRQEAKRMSQMISFEKAKPTDFSDVGKLLRHLESKKSQKTVIAKLSTSPKRKSPDYSQLSGKEDELSKKSKNAQGLRRPQTADRIVCFWKSISTHAL